MFNIYGLNLTREYWQLLALGPKYLAFKYFMRLDLAIKNKSINKKYRKQMLLCFHNISTHIGQRRLKCDPGKNQ